MNLPLLSSVVNGSHGTKDGIKNDIKMTVKLHK